MGSHHRAFAGESSEWYTPPHVFDALGLRFDLDPATAPGGVPWVPAERHYSAAEDGLSRPWRGRVWLKPPYGPQTAAWLRRAAEHGDGVALVFARTDTAWFHEIVPTASSVCFIEGRITFIGPDRRPAQHNSGVPSMLLGWGEMCGEAVIGCGMGMCFSLPDRECVSLSLFGSLRPEPGSGFRVPTS